MVLKIAAFLNFFQKLPFSTFILRLTLRKIDTHNLKCSLRGGKAEVNKTSVPTFAKNTKSAKNILVPEVLLQKHPETCKLIYNVKYNCQKREKL